MHVKRPKPWDRAARTPTPEDVYLDRRRFLKTALVAAVAPSVLLETAAKAAGVSRKALAAAVEPGSAVDDAVARGAGPSPVYQRLMEKKFPHVWPAKRNLHYKVPERPLTARRWAEGYNNFYEFTTAKPVVHKLVDAYLPIPWTIRVHGLCEKPRTFDLDDLIKGFDQEERVYRHRCVEAWAMTVPWTGFPLKKLLDKVRPLSKAKFVRFKSIVRPKQMPGVAPQPWYPWPYFEGLRLDEAMHPLTLVVTGLYGKAVPKQNGAPVRIVVPWKFGYKSPKLVQEIELVEKQPDTFWHHTVPSEYGFYSNVDPNSTHQRWSQQTERLLGEDRRVRTMLYNGYAHEVAHLYPNGDPF